MGMQKSKGCSVEQEIASVYTVVAQISGVGYSGAGSESTDTTTLDGGVFKTKGLTGYSEPGMLDIDLFFDSTLSGHQEFTDLITTPATRNFKVKNSSGTVMMGPFASAGIKPSWTIAPNAMVKGKIQIEITGDPALAS